MYRVFYESLKNLFNDFDNLNDVRIRCMEPYKLLPEGYKQVDDSVKQSPLYKKLQHYLAYFEKNKSEYPQFACLIWTLESRGIKADDNGAASENELSEQFKLVNDILKLAYW